MEYLRFLPSSPEFWAGIIGAIVGGFSTFTVERVRTRATIRQEWKRVQNGDLREFQDAVLEAVDALEVDLGEAHQIGVYHLSAQKWMPTRSHYSFHKAKMFSARIQDLAVREQWAEIEDVIKQSRSALQVAMAVADPENPFVKRTPAEVQAFAHKNADAVLRFAVLEGAKARPLTETLWTAIDKTLTDLMR